MDKLIEVLVASANKNGAHKPLTIGHLLAILKKVRDDLENQLDPPDPF